MIDSAAIELFATKAEDLAGLLPGGRVVLTSGWVPPTPPPSASRSDATIGVARIGGSAPTVVAQVPNYDIVPQETRYRGRVRNQTMVTAFIDERLRRFNGQHTEPMVDPAETKRLILAQPFADSLPPYDGFFITPQKLLWVVDAIAPTDTSWSATAFRQDGAIVCRLYGVGKGTPVTFTDDRVVVASTDADDVKSFRVYRIRR